MRLFFAFVLMMATQSGIQAQVKWDSTYRPNNYAQRVANFKSYPNSKKDIIFLGNSITDYTDWNELLQLPRARNRGISGDITFGILERLTEVAEGKPAKVFILIGTNDIARNIPDSVILNNYKRMIEGIRSASPKTKIYFNTVLPVNKTFPDKAHFNKDEHIAAVNEGLKKIGEAFNVTVIDIFTPFLDAEKRLDKRYTYDGLHLNAEGYKLWASILRPFVKK
ncbi:MAG: sialate O-acetylesterase [Chitinophagaceae bacterium]|nr:MAG: sialate O-acetylesterase [Chitinophagaceae bacterium]